MKKYTRKEAFDLAVTYYKQKGIKEGADTDIVKVDAWEEGFMHRQELMELCEPKEENPKNKWPCIEFISKSGIQILPIKAITGLSQQEGYTRIYLRGHQSCADAQEPINSVLSKIETALNQ